MTLPKDAELGEAMLALNDNRRAFVLAWLNLGARRGKQTEAAMLAGYSKHAESAKVTASRLMRDPEVIAAIQEETKKRLQSSVAMAADFLENQIDNVSVPVQTRAKIAAMLLDRGGMSVEQTHRVIHEDHRSDAELERAIMALAAKTGIDPKKLLGHAAPIEGEFEEVVPSAEGLEDLL